MKFRYVDIIENFDMPVITIVNGKEEWIYPTSKWKMKSFQKKLETCEIKKDFYVKSEKKK